MLRMASDKEGYRASNPSSQWNGERRGITTNDPSFLLLLAIPFIPGLRDIPRLIPVHRLIWRDKDYGQAAAGDTTPVSTTASNLP